MIIARTRKSKPSTSCRTFVRTTIALNLIFATILNTLFIVAATTIHLVRHWRLVCARRRGPCALRPLARAHGRAVRLMSGRRHLVLLRKPITTAAQAASRVHKRLSAERTLTVLQPARDVPARVCLPVAIIVKVMGSRRL